MSTALNNFIKYNFTIRTLIQVLYEFRIRETLNLLRINNFDSFASETTSKIKIVTIITYSAVIRSATVETSPVKKTSSHKIIILVKSQTVAKKTPSIETSHIVIINEYRSSHIDVKNAIIFASLKMKEAYNS